MAAIGKHLFKFNRGLPPDAETPAGTNADTGTGPAPFLSPIGAGYHVEMDESEAPETPYFNPRDGGMFMFETPEELEEYYQNELATTGKTQGPNGGLFQIINVVDSFPWSHSPETSMTGVNDDVPTISLLEHNILQNPALNAMMYNMFTATDILGNKIVEDGVEAAQSAVNKVTDFTNGLLSKMGDGTISAYSKAAANVLADRLKTGMDALKQTEGVGKSKYVGDLQSPYQRLYSTRPTGFKYKFPYFTDTYRYANPLFSDSSGNGNLPFQASAGKISEFFGSVVNSLNTSSSGTYIEQPKYPNFPSETKSYTFSFPLLNTVSQEATQRNWELVFMLMYQNIPNRITRSAIAPPHIYECLIPGIWYSRYAYMSKVEVTMAGSRRTMNINMHESIKGVGQTGFEDISRVKTIVPDAYMVNITMTELIPESRNLAMESIRQSDIVEIIDPTDGNTDTGTALNASTLATDFQAQLPKIPPVAKAVASKLP